MRQFQIKSVSPYVQQVVKRNAGNKFDKFDLYSFKNLQISIPVLIRVYVTDASFLVYNIKTNTVQALAPMPQPMKYFGMAMVNSEDVLVCGPTQNQPICSLYVGQLNMWTSMPPMPNNNNNGLIGFPMLILQKRPYAFGGNNYYNGIANTVYTFETGVWASRANMTQPLAWHTAVTFDNDTALVCGGRSSNNPVTTQSACNTYKATTNVWTMSANMTAPRWGHGMTIYKGTIAPFDTVITNH